MAPRQVIAASFDRVKSLCDKLHEARAMCLHIHSRLLRLDNELFKDDLNHEKPYREEYDAIVDRFYAFLVQYGKKRIITRIVSAKVVVSVCLKLHKDIDALMRICEGDGLGIDLGWNQQYHVRCKTQRTLLEQAWRQCDLLEEEFEDTDAQAEALTLIMLETNEQAEKYDSEEIKLIRRIFLSRAHLSTLEIATPEWFIPPHEVELQDQIDRGSCSSVYRGSWAGTTSVAVKSLIFQKDTENRKMFLNEANIWFSLQHPHILKLFGACHVGNPFFVCEYASNGNLPKYLEDPNNRHKTWKCLYEAALGILYLHSKKKIVHRDIKGDQILKCDAGVAKLADFGLSCLEADLPSVSDAPVARTIRWKVPEYIAGESSGSFACDVYSFGMTIIEAVTRDFPYGTIPDATLQYAVINKSHKLPDRSPEMTDRQWDLIERMCSTDPLDRVDMTVVVQELKEFADDELKNSYDRKQRELKQESDATRSQAP